jgi:hypothetical protein
VLSCFFIIFLNRSRAGIGAQLGRDIRYHLQDLLYALRKAATFCGAPDLLIEKFHSMPGTYLLAYCSYLPRYIRLEQSSGCASAAALCQALCQALYRLCAGYHSTTVFVCLFGFCSKAVAVPVHATISCLLCVRLCTGSLVATVTV